MMSSLASKTFKMAPNVEFFIGLSFRGLEAGETYVLVFEILKGS